MKVVDIVFVKLQKILEVILIFLFTTLVLDVFWQVFARYVLNISSSFTEELSRYILIWLAILGTAYLRSLKGQMSIDFVYQKMNDANKRIMDIIVEIFIIIFIVLIMIIGGVNLVYITTYLEQYSSTLQLPIGLVYSVVPISGLIMLFFSFVHLSKLIKS